MPTDREDRFRLYYGSALTDAILKAKDETPGYVFGPEKCQKCGNENNRRKSGKSICYDCLAQGGDNG